MLNGLTSAEATERQKQFGPNRLRPALQRALVLQFLVQFRNPLVLILLVASGISALTGDVTGALIIGLIVVMSVTLDFVQSYRAGRAAERLALQVAVTATVLRDGKPCELPVTEVVPGDVVMLSAGSLVPADARLLEANDFFVNQAQLTGEPFPVEKKVLLPQGAPAQAAAPETWELEAVDTIFMGSSVVSGSARVLLGRTGSATALGQIAVSLADKAPPTAFEIGTRNFGMLIMRLTLMLVLFTLLVNVAFHRSLLESFLFAVALAVGLTPELLPMVVSVTLTRGALRMAVMKVIVKRPSAIQDMGAMDVLCTDKTGTLTEARIRLERHVDALGQDSPRVLELAYLNSYFESGLKSPLDEAILQHEKISISGWRKIDEVPFDFERRRVSVLVEREGARMLAVKGAPEDILRLCTHYEDEAGAAAPLDDAVRARVGTLFDELGREGFRVLGIAWHSVPTDHPHAVVTDETELIFAGFAAFLDPPKVSAGEALAALQASRIILALKARGHVVGYLGDGINDAPSLHTADVGISVNGAVDVARHAAAMIHISEPTRQAEISYAVFCLK